MTSNSYELLDLALHQKNDEEVVRLLPLVDDDDIPFLLFSAVINGYTYGVELLAPRSGTTQNNHSLGAAVSQRYIEGVKILLPISDPSYNNSACLQRAVLNDDMDTFELLYPYSDPQIALDELLASDQFEETPQRAHSMVFVELQQRILKTKLSDATAALGTDTPQRKI